MQVRLLALVAGLTQQFAVLLLAHPLAALLDDRTYLKPPFRLIVKVATRLIVHVLPDRGNTHAQLRNPPAATTAITGIFAQYVALYSGNFW